ncbi:MAG: 3-deoxy-D-manno-octulosonic acid transferase [Candidatus Ratteibacteria bacterium]
MTCIFYDVVYGLGLLLSLFVFGKRLFGRDRRFHDFLERFAIYEPAVTSKLQGKRNIWIHTVSIGELLASLPLIYEILNRFNNEQLVISCVSRTGRIIAGEKLPDNVVKIFLPFDFSFVIHRAVKKVNPAIFISMETELWYNLFHKLKQRNVPIMILNGRISEKSFKGYVRFKFLTRTILEMVDCFVMRSSKDAYRVIQLGADRKKVSISKSMKFDQAYNLSKIVPHGPVYGTSGKTIVFGSIHKGEEKQLIDICKKLLDKYQNLNLVIAPRALDRTNIYQLLNQSGIQYQRFSTFQSEKNRVCIIDRYGVLTEFYRVADIVFVGGSLVPAGGQNPMEPLAFKKPVIYGKFHWDFEEEWEKIQKAKAGIEVNSFSELFEKIEFLLNSPELCQKMGESGYQVILENKGATEEMMKIVEKYLV